MKRTEDVRARDLTNVHIKDRMIDRLERMMDEAKNDYERDEIRREIEEIRMKK